MKFNDGIDYYFCEHYSHDGIPDVTYMTLWAGDHTRFVICRLCSTMFLGTIVGGRILEAMQNDQSS